jgi:hypothetical protein
MVAPQRGRGVRKVWGSRARLERLATEGNSPVGETSHPPSSLPEYDRARETRSESTGTTP